jgi:hypothetical protein
VELEGLIFARPGSSKDGGDSLWIWRVAANILTKQLWTADEGGPPACGLGEGLTTTHCKNTAYYEMLHRASELVGCCEHSNELSGSIKGNFLTGWVTFSFSPELWSMEVIILLSLFICHLDICILHSVMGFVQEIVFQM